MTTTSAPESTVGQARSANGSSRTEAVLRAFHEEGALGKAYDWRLTKQIWPFVRPHSGSLSVGMGSLLVAAALGLVRPLVLKVALDDGVLSGNPHVLFVSGMWLTLLVMGEQALLFLQIYAIQIAGARAMADLRREVFAFLHGLRVSFFDNQPVGRLVTRVTSDIDAILELFASGALNAIGDLIRLVGIVVLMLALDWRLALLAFVAVPPVALLVRALRPGSREAFREIRAKTARMNAMMNEQVAGMTLIQAYGRQDAAASEFDAINAQYRDANIRAIKYEAVQDAALEMVHAVALAVIIIAVGYRPVSFGTLVAFTAYLTQFFEPIGALAQRYTLLQSAMAGAERVFGLLAVRAADAPVRAASATGSSDFAFEFSGVSFAYKPEVPVLRGIDLRVRRGEKIALVGPTGAGKTTLAALLLRLYDATAGHVFAFGRDIISLDRHVLREQFAYVPQDVFLFPGSIADNIAAGGDPDLGRVEKALERIGALELFQGKSGGVLGRIDEHGANLSAGERQLIAFARALYRDAPILILDEATASIDSDTEGRLQRALAALLEDRTALVIAHRLSTIRSADRILVMQRGRIVEQGRHDELVRAGGLYARLYELQFASASEAGE